MKNLIIVNDANFAVSGETFTLDLEKNTLNILFDKDSAAIEFVNGNGSEIMPDRFLIDKKFLSYTKTVPNAAYDVSTAPDGYRQFSVTFTPTRDSGYQYNEVFVIISKRGIQFNERNVWTISAHGASADEIAEKLAENINKVRDVLGIVASVSGSPGSEVVTLTGTGYQDYDIAVKRESLGTTTDKYASTTVDILVAPIHAVKPIGDANFVKALAMAGAAERGFNSTYVDAAPTGVSKAEHFVGGLGIGTGPYVVFNIKYYNPRHDHNIDEPLTAMLHIAIDSSLTEDITDLEAILAGTYGDSDDSNSNDSNSEVGNGQS